MSFIEVSSYRLQRACVNYLVARKERIAKKREKLIDKEMVKGVFGFFKPKTREEAEKRLRERDGFCNEWDMCYYAGIAWKYKVDELVAACKIGNTVQLDVEMAEVLEDYWPA